MTKVITQEDMLQYAGKDKVVFPSGTILTPLAKDFATANHIRIAIGDSCHNDGEAGVTGVAGVAGTTGETGSCDAAREKLLRDIVCTVKKNAAGSGRDISTDELEKIVVACIERIGCRVIM